MSEIAWSNVGLILLVVPVLVHGIEVLFPMQARFIVNWVLPFFAPGLPNNNSALRAEDQVAMWDAALSATPPDKERATKDYVFLLMFEQRQGALCFAAAAVAALYGLTLGLTDRDALHLMFGVIAVLMMLANANQAGLPLFGKHPYISTNGKHVGIAFTPFWAVAAALNWISFSNAVV